MIYSEENGKPVFRCTANDIPSIADSDMQNFFPRWVLDIVERNQFPKYNKISFNLQKFPTLSEKNPKKFVYRNLRNYFKFCRERLSATEMLTIRKVIEHIYDRMIRPGIEPQEANGAGGTSVSFHSQYPANLEQRIEIYCNNQVRF